MVPYLPIILATQVLTVAMSQGNSSNCACLYKWRLRNGCSNCILMTCHYRELGSGSDWLKKKNETNWDLGLDYFLLLLSIQLHKIIRDRVISRFLKRWIPRAYDSATVLTIPMLDFHAVKSAPHPHPRTPSVPETSLNPLSPTMTKINFLLTKSIHGQEIKWSSKNKCLDLLSNSLNSIFMEMYGDQSGEFFYWGLKS